MRIVSLLGSATEIVFALGLGKHLVGVSHECDHPVEALHLPRLSKPRFNPDGMTSGDVDAAVRASMAEFGSVYTIDADLLASLRPDVVLTQAVCEVCAVPTGSVEAAVRALGSSAEIVSLDGHTLSEIFGTFRQVANAVGRPELGDALETKLSRRLEAVSARVGDRERPRVLMIEWLDPPFAPGHWVPEMVSAAGGENLLGEAGKRSVQVEWSEVVEAGRNADYLLIEPCGFDLDQARRDADLHRKQLELVAAGPLAEQKAWVLHSAWFSRSGPRVVEGIETLARILHAPAFDDAPLPAIARRYP